MGYDGLYCEIPALISVVFSSHMVLQRAPKQAVIFGAANSTVPYDHLVIALSEGDGGTWGVTADANGSWSLTLPPRQATTVGATLSARSNSTGRVVTLTDVVFGDVYMCAGQSNMALSVQGAFLPYASASEVEALAPQYQNIRLLNNGNFWPWYASKPGSTPMGTEAGNPPGFRLLTSGNGTWHSPGTIANFSASCFFFGTALSNSLGGDVPIGLIDNSAGGTSIVFWSSPDAIAMCNQTTPSSSGAGNGNAGVLFDAMILPLSPMALSGIVYFQGESNACGYTAPGEPCGGEYYACQLRAMIRDWRSKLRDATLPFLVTELCALTQPQWPNLRAAQREAVSGLVRAGTLPNHDLGWEDDMHSRRKARLGWRQHLWMLGMVYGDRRRGGTTLVVSGPALQSATIAPSNPTGVGGVKITVVFTPNTSTGLHFNGTGDCDYAQPKGFDCCGETQSPLAVRVANASAADGTGWTWVRTGFPVVVDSVSGVIYATLANTSAVDLSRLRLSHEGYPTCAFYNGEGGPEGSAMVAEPWDVVLDAQGHPTPVPVPTCIYPCPIQGLPDDCCGLQ